MPRTATKITPEQLADAHRRRTEDGTSIRALARELGLSDTVLRRRLQRYERDQAEREFHEQLQRPSPAEPTLHWSRCWLTGDGHVLLLDPFEAPDGSTVTEGTAWSFDAIAPQVMTCRRLSDPRVHDELAWFSRRSPDVLDEIRNRWISPGPDAPPEQLLHWPGAYETSPGRVRTGGWLQVEREDGSRSRRAYTEWFVLRVNPCAFDLKRHATYLRRTYGRDSYDEYPGYVASGWRSDFDPDYGVKTGEVVLGDGA